MINQNQLASVVLKKWKIRYKTFDNRLEEFTKGHLFGIGRGMISGRVLCR